MDKAIVTPDRSDVIAPATMEIVRAFDAQVEQKLPGERSLVLRAGSGEIDRYHTVVQPSGIDVSHFNKNPIFLYDHGKHPIRGSLPIGRGWARFRPSENDLIAKIIFYTDEFSQLLYDMYSSDPPFARGWSLRALPHGPSCGPPSWDEVQRQPELSRCEIMYRKCELIEISACPANGNRDAVTLMISRGFMSEAEGEQVLERTMTSMTLAGGGALLAPPGVTIQNNTPADRYHFLPGVTTGPDRQAEGPAPQAKALGMAKPSVTVVSKGAAGPDSADDPAALPGGTTGRPAQPDSPLPDSGRLAVPTEASGQDRYQGPAAGQVAARPTPPELASPDDDGGPVPANKPSNPAAAPTKTQAMQPLDDEDAGNQPAAPEGAILDQPLQGPRRTAAQDDSHERGDMADLAQDKPDTPDGAAQDSLKPDAVGRYRDHPPGCPCRDCMQAGQPGQATEAARTHPALDTNEPQDGPAVEALGPRDLDMPAQPPAAAATTLAPAVPQIARPESITSCAMCRHIEKRGDAYVILNHDKTKVLGRYRGKGAEAKANKRLGQIEYFKNRDQQARSYDEVRPSGASQEGYRPDPLDKASGEPAAGVEATPRSAPEPASPEKVPAVPAADAGARGPGEPGLVASPAPTASMAAPPNRPVDRAAPILTIDSDGQTWFLRGDDGVVKAEFDDAASAEEARSIATCPRRFEDAYVQARQYLRRTLDDTKVELAERRNYWLYGKMGA